ncbi:hypothetical protein Tco_1300388 [Tanacetum coccineum]
MPTIKEGEVIEEFRTRNDDLDIGTDDYPILKDMDVYRDEGMGDIIVGEPFLREGDALDAINLDIMRMEESDAVPVTPGRLATRVSKLRPSPEKRRVKPSSYLLSPYMNDTRTIYTI